MIWNITVIAIGLTIPVVMKNPAWWHWLLWPGIMWVVFGGWRRVFAEKHEHYQKMQQRINSRPKQEESATRGSSVCLNANDLQTSARLGALYADYGAALNVVRRIENHRATTAAEGKAKTENEKEFAAKWKNEMKRIEREISKLS